MAVKTNTVPASSMVVVASCYGAVLLPVVVTLHKVDGITKKEEYLQILHLKTARRLKLRHSWVFKQDHDPKPKLKLV